MKFPPALAGAVLFSLSLSLCLAAAQAPATREWRSVDGGKVEASVVAFDGTNVTLKLANGATSVVPLLRLVPEDQALVKAMPVKKAPRTWPETVQVSSQAIEVKLMPESQGSGKYVYRSEGFEYTSQGKLLPSLMNEVARTFEATRKLVGALPWGLVCRPPEGLTFYQAALYETRDEYIRAGGPTNSGGVYMTGEKIFKIPFESLGIKRLGKSYTKDENYRSDTLVHEITHQMMHDVLPYLPMWAIEGSAEYTEMLPYKSGSFGVKRHREGLKEYLENWQKRGRTPMVPDVAHLFRMKRQEWSAEAMETTRQHALYQQSALLVYYFNHLDGDGTGARWMRFMDATQAEAASWRGYEKEFATYRVAMDAFLKLPGVKKGEGGQFSYPSNLTPPKAPQQPGGEGATQESTPLRHLDVLLDGRSDEELQKDIAAKYAKAGVKLGM